MRRQQFTSHFIQIHLSALLSPHRSTHLASISIPSSDTNQIDQYVPSDPSIPLVLLHCTRVYHPASVVRLTSTGCRSTDLMRSDRAVSFFFTSSRSGWCGVLLDSVECVSGPESQPGRTRREDSRITTASLARTMVAATPFPSPLPKKTKGWRTTRSNSEVGLLGFESFGCG